MTASGKMTATAQVRVDPKKYGRLLSRTLPMVIETEDENERMLVWAESPDFQKTMPE